jgi:calcineurin-like phosphoesterase family protein
MKFLFYQTLNINSLGSDVFFWSDTHFNHLCEHWSVPLWKARGFETVEHHAETLIERWNNKCSNSSICFHLGDFIFGYDSIQNFKQIIKRLKFKELYIMPGNHHSGWRQVFEQQRTNIWNITDQKRVIFVPNYLEIGIEDQHIILSHYPILSFNRQNKGSWCLYGHVHGNLIKHEIGKIYDNAKTFEVSIENCPSPISFVELKEIMDKKSSAVFDQAWGQP